MCCLGWMGKVFVTRVTQQTLSCHQQALGETLFEILRCTVITKRQINLVIVCFA